MIDRGAAERAHEVLAKAADRDGWRELLDRAWPSLAPAFAASPYLTSLARAAPDNLRTLLERGALTVMDGVIAETKAAAGLDLEAGAVRLRQLKAQTHLAVALADLGGIWDLDAVTGALTRFADAALGSALAIVAGQEVARGRLLASTGDAGPAPGYFCIAMGKYGAHELNYSSDIDYSFFFEPDDLPVAEGVEPREFAVQLTQAVSRLMQERTSDGYVFRVDLRLRPDPSSTAPAVPVAAAFDYYETVGQNWERAAFIKARVCAGDMAAGQAFLDELAPFVWRRNLDFGAIDDIHSIKRQIHVHKVDDRLTAKGADLKLGHGGIREIEFYVQTQQLILGGRDPSLRSPRTVDSLADLAAAGQVAPKTAAELTEAYGILRALEHRAQMVADQQTHKLPEADADRRRIAALYGRGDLRKFDAAVTKLLKRVNRRYGELFAEGEDLSSRFGSLVFTGVEDDPETLATIKRMGFSNPPQIAQAIRSWHHGRILATRTERGREQFTRLAPRLLEAAHATGAPDEAFGRFADFFSGLTSGVQVQSLFLAQPRLFELIVEVMAFAPRLAAVLARRPSALDAMLDQTFFQPFASGEAEAGVRAAVARVDGFEEAMDAVRRAHRETSFRIGVQVMSGVASAAEAGPAFADLADGCMRALGPAALAETERLAGAFTGEVAIVALGKCGSREMTARSDLDLMTLYSAKPGGASASKGWAAETFYGRFTQRLVAALSAPTAEGELYEVDLQLRPSGTKGPVAVSMAAFEDYYSREAETWELLALSRARIVWATSPAFAEAAALAVAAALCRPRDHFRAAADVLEMRALMEQERPPSGFWDLKLSQGGLVDIEFAAEFLQIVNAAGGGPLAAHTGEALIACKAAGLAAPEAIDELFDAWTLQQNLSQVLKVALADGADPASEPRAFRSLLARSGGARDLRGLESKLRRKRERARAAFEAVIR
ncbi:bifunctional [glutamine synthetase] adenylyltransferase/[glutamine synthetase]-adenylyl-L-tyrosine phosphorylase [soil metagenome]